MSASALLTRLEGVRQRGPHRWSARCPSHEDKSPSLSIREEPDGRILIHCFAGCAVEEVLSALDLQFSDLFPPRPIDHAAPVKRPWHARDLVTALDFELTLALVVLEAVHRGEPVDLERVGECRARIVRFLTELQNVA